MVVPKRNRRLGEVAKVISGYAFKSSEFLETGIPVIKIKNIKLGEVDMSDTQFVSKEYLNIDEKFHVNEGDILISLTGSHINQPNSVVGRVALFPNGFGDILLNQRAGKIIPINDECDTRFLYYQLYEKEMRKDIASFAHGAANQANVSPSQVESLTIRTPPLKTQHKIAAILSAYDDLIENNLRRIKILEEMAQNLYREWFVNFRFPGHEQTRFADSHLGCIPEGWVIKSLIDFGEIITGKTPSKIRFDYYGDDMPFIKLPDMHNNIYCIKTIDNLSKSGADSQKSKTLPPNSLCVSCIGTVGKVAITAFKSQTNQQINSIIPYNRENLEFLFFSLLGLKEKIELYSATGATMNNLSRGKFISLRVITPSEKLIKKYHDLVLPCFRSILNLQLKNELLKKTRDLLLPKLISGEVDVSELDINVSEEEAV